MREALLTIRGLEGSLEDGSDIELVTVGNYEWSPERVTFSYMETELTGLKGTMTEFLVEEKQVTITRTGLLSMQMIFREGEKQYFIYGTPIGNMTMGIDTQSIHKKLGEFGGSIEVRYMMDFGSAMVSRNHFKVDIKTVPQPNMKGTEK